MSDRTGRLSLDEFTVEVLVLDERTVYGRKEYRVTPTAGSGESWVYAHRVEITD